LRTAPLQQINTSETQLEYNSATVSKFPISIPMKYLFLATLLKANRKNILALKLSDSWDIIWEELSTYTKEAKSYIRACLSIRIYFFIENA